MLVAHSVWLADTGIKNPSSFNQAINKLAEHDYVFKAGRDGWTLTDAGLAALPHKDDNDESRRPPIDDEHGHKRIPSNAYTVVHR